jgi:hypothetical protein
MTRPEGASTDALADRSAAPDDDSVPGAPPVPAVTGLARWATAPAGRVGVWVTLAVWVLCSPWRGARQPA